MRQFLRNHEAFTLLLLIAAYSLSIRVLINTELDHSALLYIAIPFFIGLSITLFTRASDSNCWKRRYWNLLRYSLIIMLGSSIVLMEGFICVLMFMPIYFGVITLFFLLELIYRKSQRSRLSLHIFPALIILSSIEGTTPELSLNRQQSVSHQQTVPLSIEQLHDNMRQPIQLNQQTHGLLSLFPMPYRVEAGSLEPGDVHISYLRYHRWFFTNTHEGQLSLRIDSVEPEHIQASFIHNSSYLATYLQLHGLDIQFDQIAPQQTQVTLRIKYDRKLDPAWYFSPLEQYAVQQASAFLTQHIIVRNNN